MSATETNLREPRDIHYGEPDYIAALSDRVKFTPHTGGTLASIPGFDGLSVPGATEDMARQRLLDTGLQRWVVERERRSFPIPIVEVFVQIPQRTALTR